MLRERRCAREVIGTSQLKLHAQLIQFSTSAQFKARATNGRIDWLGWRLSKIRDFCQFSKSPGYKLGQRREKAGSSGFGSGTRQSHFRNCTYEVLSSWYKIVYTHSKAGSG